MARVRDAPFAIPPVAAAMLLLCKLVMSGSDPMMILPYCWDVAALVLAGALTFLNALFMAAASVFKLLNLNHTLNPFRSSGGALASLF